MNKLTIDLVSDVVCPWCVVGFKRLQLALDSIADQVEVEVEFHPFELNPEMPAGGQELREHIAEKYGSTPEQSQQVRDMLSAIGNQIGFEFRWGEGARIYNTFKAHQLLTWAEQYHKKTQLKMALFDAYFTQNQPVDKDAVLIQAVREIGLDEAEAQAALDSGEFASQTREELNFWKGLGISSVPSYVINKKHLISGAQEPQVLAQALLEIAQEKP